MDGQLRMDASGFDVGRLLKAVDEATPAALAKAGEHLRSTAVGRAPVESGHLVGTAEVHVSEDRASVTFDGPYARYQELTLDLHHPHGGQALYLTSTIVSERDTALGIVSREIKDAL